MLSQCSHTAPRQLGSAGRQRPRGGGSHRVLPKDDDLVLRGGEPRLGPSAPSAPTSWVLLSGECICHRHHSEPTGGGMMDPSDEEELQDSEVHLCEEDAIRLDALHLHRSPDCLLIAACLLQQPFQLSVRKLSLEWTYVRAYAVPYAAALLRATATTLEHLRVSFQGMPANVRALIPAALEPLRDAALTSLYIGRLNLPPPWRMSSSEFTWVPALLTRVEPARLRSVIFDLRLFSSDIDPLPWSEIDTRLARLARARPLGLRVTFEMSCDGHMLLGKEVTDAVLHRLPMLRTCPNVAVEVTRLIDCF
ncbi:uncharacterized protein B0H18DRAFT_146439 [Fomitopsis serialis]|uniref:uncharacterized protein n=1 Tax=Fomitopsis serialis TaxID=139415 RepID=UPI00200770D0|nr:uncharacterized protein B0H18DRAFT_146439 [Neoantrodia serialis]KAH9930290.1 hypothetical protein B0H18DRAFT_146439 [Neoantrodia serialis]